MSDDEWKLGMRKVVINSSFLRGERILDNKIFPVLPSVI